MRRPPARTARTARPGSRPGRARRPPARSPSPRNPWDQDSSLRVEDDREPAGQPAGALGESPGLDAALQAASELGAAQRRDGHGVDLAAGGDVDRHLRLLHAEIRVLLERAVVAERHADPVLLVDRDEVVGVEVAGAAAEIDLVEAGAGRA